MFCDFEGSAMIGALSQLAECQVFLQNPTTTEVTLTATQDSMQLLKVEDPLRELVLYSNDKNADPEKLKFLAHSAANLVTEDSNSSSNPIPKNMKILTGIFTGTGTFIKNMEDSISKKYSVFDDPSEDEFGGKLPICRKFKYFVHYDFEYIHNLFLFLERPMLGKLARARRAKSALVKNFGKSRFSDKRKLLQASDSSSSDLAEPNYKRGISAPPSLNVHHSNCVNPVIEMEEENM